MAQMTRARTTAADFAQLEETTLPTELIDGEIVVSPAPTISHQRSLFDIGKVVEQLIPDGEVFLAPVDVYLDDFNVVQPDIFWISASGQCHAVEDRFFRGAPDLIIEIFSPSTRRRDKGVKFDLYEQHGVREYWMADLEDQYIEVYRLESNRLIRQGLYIPGQTFESSVLGGKTVHVDHLLGIPSN